MYPHHYPPPYGMSPEDVERIAKVAIRLKERDARKKAKAKEVEERKAKESSGRMFSALEWFIVGVLLHPIVGPLYNLAIHKVTSMVP